MRDLRCAKPRRGFDHFAYGGLPHSLTGSQNDALRRRSGTAPPDLGDPVNGLFGLSNLDAA